ASAARKPPLSSELRGSSTSNSAASADIPARARCRRIASPGIFRLGVAACSNVASAARTISRFLPCPAIPCRAMCPPASATGWKSLVGIYRYSSYNAPDANMIILERNRHLFMQPSGDQGKSEEIREERDTVWIDDGNGRWYGYSEHRNDAGVVKDFTYLAEAFIRI